LYSSMTVRVTPGGTRGTRMPGGPLVAVVMSAIGGVYRLLGGRGMGKTGILTTFGAKTGKRRDAQIAVFKEKGGWLVIGSYGGSATHPAWVVNMAHNPDRVWLQVGGRRLHVSPRSLEGAERGSAWKRIVSEAPNFGDYEKKTDREIPVIELTSVE